MGDDTWLVGQLIHQICTWHSCVPFMPKLWFLSRHVQISNVSCQSFFYGGATTGMICFGQSVKEQRRGSCKSRMRIRNHCNEAVSHEPLFDSHLHLSSLKPDQAQLGSGGRFPVLGVFEWETRTTVCGYQGCSFLRRCMALIPGKPWSK